MIISIIATKNVQYSANKPHSDRHKTLMILSRTASSPSTKAFNPLSANVTTLKSLHPLIGAKMPLNRHISLRWRVWVTIIQKKNRGRCFFFYDSIFKVVKIVKVLMCLKIILHFNSCYFFTAYVDILMLFKWRL